MKEKLKKEVKIHNFLVCAYNSQDFAATQENFAQTQENFARPRHLETLGLRIIWQRSSCKIIKKNCS